MKLRFTVMHMKVYHMLSSAPKPNDLLLYVEISQSSFAATIILRKSAGQSAGLQRIVLPVNKQPSRSVKSLITIFSPCFLSKPWDHFGKDNGFLSLLGYDIL